MTSVRGFSQLGVSSLHLQAMLYAADPLLSCKACWTRLNLQLLTVQAAAGLRTAEVAMQQDLLEPCLDRVVLLPMDPSYSARCEAIRLVPGLLQGRPDTQVQCVSAWHSQFGGSDFDMLQQRWHRYANHLPQLLHRV